MIADICYLLGAPHVHVPALLEVTFCPVLAALLPLALPWKALCLADPVQPRDRPRDSLWGPVRGTHQWQEFLFEAVGHTKT